MKKTFKTALVIFIITICLSIIKISDKYTWTDNFLTKLFCALVEVIFVSVPLYIFYFELFDINKQD